LASEVEGILKGMGLQIASISGTDQQLTDGNNTSSENPQPVPMPISFSVSGTNYQGVEALMNKLQQSIRPFAIDTLSISGGNNELTVTINAHSYYQPSKTLQILSKTVQ